MNNSQLAVPPSLQESSSTTPVTSKSTVSISSSPSAPDLLINKTDKQAMSSANFKTARRLMNQSVIDKMNRGRSRFQSPPPVLHRKA